MKNAAAIRRSVSGPVSVFVISGTGVGFSGVGVGVPEVAGVGGVTITATGASSL